MATAEVIVERGEFRNEPFTDFTDAKNKAAMQAALAKVKSQLGREYPLIIGGRRVSTAQKIESHNPSRPAEIIGIFSAAGVAETNEAVDAAQKAFASWSRVPYPDRAAVLFRTADLLRQRKHEFNAWICYEAGKTWPEADADTAETIDFCEFYAREMMRLGGPQPLNQLKGEKGYLLYIPLGVGAIVPPWNFPCAIMAGLTGAAIVTGNTVVLKPSSDTPTVACQFLELLFESGLPEGVVNFCVGRGATVGDTLVANPKTRFIGFTGSKEVGLHIQEVASRTQPGQIWIKRTVLEMGGKDAIVVDDEADVDSAVEGVAVSAFGYQGQKCSACSRAIVTEKVYDTFLQKLIERTKKIKVGEADDPGNYMGPVINKGAMKTILDYIEIGKKEGRLVAGGHAAGGEGYFIEPTIIADVSPKSRIAQEEIFGPVLAVIKARNFDQALEFANDSEFGLTGAVYSRNAEKLRRASESFHVGNLYLNRKCTGAMVGAHPFGGFNMSGTDSKAGGRDYLLLFTQAKVIAEKQ
jgi:1-pyrroline-5-carboxylate dehydrogenase